MTIQEKQLERVQQIKNKIEKINSNSKRKAAERMYALELITFLERQVKKKQQEDFLTDARVLRKLLLNGAKDWTEYSKEGNSLCYDVDIINRIGKGDSPLLERQAMYLSRACELIVEFNREVA